MQDELAVAEMFNRPIFPIWALGTDGTWPDCVPLGMVKRQYVDLRGEHYAANLPALLAALKEPEAAAAIPEPADLPEGFEPKIPIKV